MLKSLIISFCVLFVAASCLKSSKSECPYSNVSVTVPPSELEALATFLDTNNLEATQDPAGYFYNIVTPGTGTDSLGLCSVVRIKYRGTFTNGVEFDKQTEAVDFVLGRFIEGWKKGMQKIKKGGKMKLYVPPSLGYGSQDLKDDTGKVIIPRNSILLFDIELIDYTPAN
jgi:FKBP-type peptidyl-prolyl cis-trans isomerase FkpA